MRPEDLTAYPDNVSNVALVEEFILIPEAVAAEVDLDLSRGVTEVNEGGLPHSTASHDAPGKAHRRIITPLKEGDGLLCGVATVVAVGIGVDALAANSLELFAALLGYIIDASHYFISTILSLSTPAGAATSTSSPTRLSSNAFPIGDSLEIFPSPGLASTLPTIV